MENLRKEYKETIKYFLTNKVFISVIILVAILSFGFTITNPSVGMDETAFGRYYQDKEMLESGRWGSYLIYRGLGITEFIPFWVDFLVASLIVITAVLWCVFLKKNLGEKLSLGAYIIFATIFISFPLINEWYLFSNSSLAVIIGTFLASLGIMIFYENYNKIHKKIIYLAISMMLAFAFSMYEACGQVMLVSICITAILMIYTQKDKKVKDIFKYMFASIAIIALAVILNQIIVKLIYLGGVRATNEAEKEINWGKYGILESLQLIAINVIDVITNTTYFPILIFDIASIIGLAISILQYYKRNNLMILLIFIAMFLSNFVISMLQLNMVLHRTCTSWGLFVAIIIMITYKFLSEYNITKILSGIAIIILVLLQTKNLNQLFYNDYKRYQKDLKIAHELIYDLEKTCDTSKPLVIMGMPYKGMGDYGTQSNSLSVLWWGKKAFGDNGAEFIKFLNSFGYNYERPNDEQYEKGKIEAETMNIYPQEDSIRELEDCIVVNF